MRCGLPAWVTAHYYGTQRLPQRHAVNFALGIGASAQQAGALQGEEFKDTPDQAGRNGEGAKKGGLVQHGVTAQRRVVG